MYADVVFFLEGLPQHVDGIVEQDEGIQGVDAVVRGNGGMCRLAMEGDLFIDETGEGGIE